MGSLAIMNINNGKKVDYEKAVKLFMAPHYRLQKKELNFHIVFVVKNRLAIFVNQIFTIRKLSTFLPVPSDGCVSQRSKGLHNQRHT